VTYPKGKLGYALPAFFQIMVLHDSDKNWGTSIKIVLITIFLSNEDTLREISPILVAHKDFVW